jgi:hypothetical protein
MPYKKKSKVKLIKNHLEIFNEYYKDSVKNKYVTKAVFSYFDEKTKEEYRKSFTAKPYTSEEKMWQIAPEIIYK